jgi:hypothetical protein
VTARQPAERQQKRLRSQPHARATYHALALERHAGRVNRKLLHVRRLRREAAGKQLRLEHEAIKAGGKPKTQE